MPAGHPVVLCGYPSLTEGGNFVRWHYINIEPGGTYKPAPCILPSGTRFSRSAYNLLPLAIGLRSEMLAK